MAKWICANCGAEHETNNKPCRECAHERFAKLEPEDSPKQIEASPTTLRWKCEECGKEHVRNNPPCSRCGNAPLQKIEVETGEGVDPSLDEPSLTPSASRRNVVKYGGAIAGVLAVGGYLFLNRHSASFREFRSRLEDSSLEIKSLTEEKRRWVLEYFPDSARSLTEIGRLAATYAETVPSRNENPDHQVLDAILYRAGPQRIGSFSIRASSARAYRDGRISWEEYTTPILASALQ